MNGPVRKGRKIRLTRRKLLCAAGATASAAVGTGLYAWRIEPHWLERVALSLPIRNLPQHLIGSRLVQLSDLHIGPHVDEDYLDSVFDTVVSLEPDIIVYTGDFLNHDANVETQGRRMLSRLPLGTRGTCGILGNHDYGSGWSQPQKAARIAALAEDRGVQVLRNRVASVAGLQIMGLDDLWVGRFHLRDAMKNIDHQEASLALAHNPDAVDRPGWAEYSGWILAGHTHGGQVKPPFLPPPQLPVRNRRYCAGQYTLDGGRTVYVNRGVGHVLRVRFNVRPEITVFTLDAD